MGFDCGLILQTTRTPEAELGPGLSGLSESQWGCDHDNVSGNYQSNLSFDGTQPCQIM